MKVIYFTILFRVIRFIQYLYLSLYRYIDYMYTYSVGVNHGRTRRFLFSDSTSINRCWSTVIFFFFFFFNNLSLSFVNYDEKFLFACVYGRYKWYKLLMCGRWVKLCNSRWESARFDHVSYQKRRRASDKRERDTGSSSKTMRNRGWGKKN